MADFSSSLDTTEGQSHDYSIDAPRPSGMSDAAKGGLRSAGSSMSSGGSSQISAAADRLGQANPGVRSFKKGGKVRKTGLAYLHKGERVLNTKQEKSRQKKARKSHGRGNRGR